LHIWYIHHYGGGPGIGLYDRPYQLARAWQRQGHSATIFIAGFHHLLEQGHSPEPEFEVDGVRYVALPARPYAQNGTARMLNIWDFSRNLYTTGRRYAQGAPRPDAVIASSPHPFTIFPAHSLARRYGAKLAFEIRDIWPLSITEILGTSRLHPFVQMCAAAERFAFGQSDLVASVLPRADRYLADRGYGHKPFAWVPNGVGRQDVNMGDVFTSPEASLAADKASKWRSEGLPVVIYTGSVGRPNAIDLLVHGLAHGGATERKEPCAALIVGKGDQLEALRSFARAHQLENIHFSGAVPKADAVKLLGSADVGYAGLRNIETLFGYGISPNKIADYLGASLPVLLPLAPCGDPVSESGGGIARKAETPQAVWEALRELIGLSPEQRHSMGAKGREYIAREYDYDRIANRYAEAIAAA
jgi:glycosyltransferase involved in cell wall biosynthesis